MREIFFRGKHASSGQWVYGMTYGEIFVMNYGQFEHTNKFAIQNNDGYSVEVIPETVGQYTGLTDKKGKKIFEGDIIKQCVGRGYIGQTIKVVYVDEWAGFFPFIDEGLNDATWDIIGNIYDNPELL